MPSLKLLFFLLIPAMLFAQQHSVLTAKTKAETVESICRSLLDSYIFPDTAKKMADKLRKRIKEGAYNKITDPVAFSDALTLDLYSIYQDRHMQVRYVQATNPAVLENTIFSEDLYQRTVRANFGLSKAEVLPGNIGYINIMNFWADNINGRATVKAALQFVSHTNALIIDLRNCGGGSQETVALICGYFLEEPVLINRMFDRRDNTTTEFWARPDSTFTAVTKMPLYVLTSKKTFSAAEEFCYDLQNLERATIVGEVTGGGAHGKFEQDLPHGFVISIPYSRAINPVSLSNWEGTGVQPHIVTTADAALETAEMQILDDILAKTTDKGDLFRLNWDRELLKAASNPITPETAALQKFAGVYGERTVTFENGKLFYQRAGRPKFEMEAMSATMMKPKGNNYFKVEFKENSLTAYYQDNRVETDVRTK